MDTMDSKDAEIMDLREPRILFPLNIQIMGCHLYVGISERDARENERLQQIKGALSIALSEKFNVKTEIKNV